MLNPLNLNFHLVFTSLRYIFDFSSINGNLKKDDKEKYDWNGNEQSCNLVFKMKKQHGKYN
jgi:hypothetical protein